MPKNVPLRRCCGCMQHFEKKALTRVVRTPEGEVVLDPSGKRSGRGAYVCAESACRRKLRKSGRLAASLSATVPDAIYDELEKQNERETG